MSNKKYRGFSLIELLVAVIVLGILSSMYLYSGSRAQERARITSELTAIEDFESAFIAAYSDHPGIVSSRKDNWPHTGLVDYSSERGLAKIVRGMNVSLQDSLQFKWDPDLKVYRSVGNDPWNGYYILTEYPYESDEDFDPENGMSKGSAMIAIFATGMDRNILEGKVSDLSKGVAFEYKNGDFTKTYQGLEDSFVFSGRQIIIQ